MAELFYIKRGDPDYPEQFERLYDPPKAIYAYGDLSGLRIGPGLSVVGTRAISAYGRDVTTRLVREVASAGVAVISGLALGVDSVAHRAALEAKGYTVAVLAGGLDRIHPRNHTRLAEEILAQGGAIISEYALGEPALKHQFVERNRLVAALGEGLLVTEAAVKSGTMHTVDFASDMGKTIMAVPGNITSATSIGTNNLIKDNALPVTESSDILIALGLNVQPQQSLAIGENAQETAILTLMMRGISDMHTMLKVSEMSAANFNRTITILELTGKIRRLGTDQWGLS